MRYIQITGPEQLLTGEKEKPRPAPGQALLKVLYGGICGSDISLYRGHMSAYASFPRIPGHELAAELVLVNGDAGDLKPGETVTVNPYFNCGRCYSCRRGYVNCCVNNQTMGLQREGGFAEYIAVPVERVYSGQGLDPQDLALVEPFCISHHALSRAALKTGERVLVMGAGAIGIFAMLSAKLRGAEVYVCDVAAPKLDFAAALGADGLILNSGPEDFLRQTEEASRGDGFDVLIEAVGLPQTLLDCLAAGAHMSRIVEVGIGSRNLDFAFNIIQKKELNIMGSRNALRRDFLELISVLKSKTVSVAGMVTNVYGFDEAARAFAETAANTGTNLKSLIRF
ncbi:MAG: alcohol dehydrogenase catalytic domain-containing protein [Desulfarculales bacterium]|jgi:2-desacetyl-2-hydroxyethyl bacteriochlorophyllide A dehydrogenase|nr:alcohol dehydrogenase catalytic domain-containing protein [Desulfarculales bacterium]